MKLPFDRLGDSEERAIDALVEKLREASRKGYQVVATYVAGKPKNFDVIPYWELDWIKPTVLVLGNEGKGLHPKVQACCTHAVTLPHNEIVESLNVAAAPAPLLLERFRAKMTT